MIGLGIVNCPGQSAELRLLQARLMNGNTNWPYLESFTSRDGRIILSQIPLCLLPAWLMNPKSTGHCLESIQLAKGELFWHDHMIDNDETRSVIIFLQQLLMDNSTIYKTYLCTIITKLQNKVWQCIQDYSVLAGGKMAEICGLPCERWKGGGFCARAIHRIR